MKSINIKPIRPALIAIVETFETSKNNAVLVLPGQYREGIAEIIELLVRSSDKLGQIGYGLHSPVNRTQLKIRFESDVFDSIAGDVYHLNPDFYINKSGLMAIVMYITRDKYKAFVVGGNNE